MLHSTIYLIRHGQSQANVGGITLENPLVPLTELGHLQARTVAALLPAAAPSICSSPFKRALDTASPYCGRVGLTPITHDDLREFEVVDTLKLRGAPGAERTAILTRFWLTAEPDLRTGAGAETFREFHDRVTRVRTQLLPALPDGTVIFGHGMWMALLFWQLWGFEKLDHTSMIQFRSYQLGFPTPNAVVYGLTHLAPGTWHIRVNEPALRAVAAAGQGFDQTANEDAAASEPATA
jgi:alpha-ribazole phosphatase